MAPTFINTLPATMRRDCVKNHSDHASDSLKSSEARIDNAKRGRTLKIIGVGGAGVNILDRVSTTAFENAEMIVADMDSVHLMLSSVPRRILMMPAYHIPIEAEHTPADGRNAALEAEEELREALLGAYAVIILCGLGGGTGTGAAPVIARIARDAELMTAAVCVWPIAGEGRIPEINAGKVVDRLMKATDLVVLIPNEVITGAKLETPVDDAITAMDAVILRALKGIAGFYLDLERNRDMR